jgi:hypothetical protein
MKNHHWLEELGRHQVRLCEALRFVKGRHCQTALFVDEDVHLLADVNRPV